MVSSKVFFARMNEKRNGNWLTDGQLMDATSNFYRLNGYDQIEHNKAFTAGGNPIFFPIVGSRPKDLSQDSNKQHDEKQPHNDGQTIAAIFNSRIERLDATRFRQLEALLYIVIDNYSDTNLMLVTDSLSHMPITKIEDLSVAVQNLMDQGMYILFVNNRLAHALFDRFEMLTRPIPVVD